MIKTYITMIGAVALLFSGCATTSSLSSLTTPAQIQKDITVAGSLVVPNVSPAAKGAVHLFATELLALNVSQLDAATIESLIPVVPARDKNLIDAAIGGGVTVINLAISKFGSHNTVVLAYVNAVGNGLLAAGF